MFSQITFSQKIVLDTCKLQFENKNWIAVFENAKNDADRIVLIRQKIKSDSIYSEVLAAVPEIDMPSVKTENINADGKFCGCRIRFNVFIDKNTPVEANLNSNPKLSESIDKFNIQTIERIEYINKKDALSLFGPVAKEGVVEIYIKSNSLKRDIKKLAYNSSDN
jgi:hypothetical protein